MCVCVRVCVCACVRVCVCSFLISSFFFNSRNSSTYFNVRCRSLQKSDRTSCPCDCITVELGICADRERAKAF